MKALLIAIAILATTYVVSAANLVSRSGQISFYSHTPIEDIIAHNRQGVSILDPETGAIQISLLIKSFEFKIALMQEHFNENYMESDKFPKSTFNGKVTQIDKVNFKRDGVYSSDVTGDLTIHGVTKNITVPGTFEVKDGKVTGKAKFLVSPRDYGISIPSVVENKIARDIEITLEFPYYN